jgi:hypothetical protein
MRCATLATTAVSAGTTVADPPSVLRIPPTSRWGVSAVADLRDTPELVYFFESRKIKLLCKQTAMGCIEEEEDAMQFKSQSAEGQQ